MTNTSHSLNRMYAHFSASINNLFMEQLESEKYLLFCNALSSAIAVDSVTIDWFSVTSTGTFLVPSISGWQHD